MEELNTQPVDLIAAKREGSAHSREELRHFVSGIASGLIPDYQAAAWLMAAYLNGLDSEETIALALAMRDSGSILEWSEGPGLSDKHSTGGVGDKISLILAPLAAEAGLRIPMISGRSLAHTGGTLDKLESIPGMSVDLELAEFVSLVETNRVAMCGQTPDLAPADRRLYSLRDATATVSSIPLICASILSKKLAEGTDSLVFDVKAGRGAFMKDTASARELAAGLTGIARSTGVNAVAMVTSMDRPLGLTVGNALEVREAIEVLRGSGPTDIRDLTLDLAAAMLASAGMSEAENGPSIEDLGEMLDNGRAYSRFVVMVESQGGDLEAFDALPTAAVRMELTSDRSGVWSGMDAGILGETVRMMGGGRYRMDQVIDPLVGWEQLLPCDTAVIPGEPLALLHASDNDSAAEAVRLLQSGIIWNEPAQPLIREVL